MGISINSELLTAYQEERYAQLIHLEVARFEVGKQIDVAMLNGIIAFCDNVKDAPF